MNTSDNLSGVLAALAQPTRLHAFRELVKQEPNGLQAGDIARRLSVPHNTMSAHLRVLARAGLVTVERRSRNQIYRARLVAIHDLVLFLLQECCDGQPELCLPLINDLDRCRRSPLLSGIGRT